ncbi:MAG: zinc-binding dehydrogenase [Pseudomonadales bacterium]
MLESAINETVAPVALFGLGGIRLSSILGAAMANASRILAVDISLKKCETAEALGAIESVNPKDLDGLIQDVVVDLTGGVVDFSFERICNPDIMRSLEFHYS